MSFLQLRTRGRILAAGALLFASLAGGCQVVSLFSGGAEETAGAVVQTPAPVISSEETEQPVVWQDARFESCIRALLNMPSGEIYPSDLKTVTQLCFYGASVCRTTDDAYRYDAATDSVSIGGKVYVCQPISLADVVHFSALESLAVYGGEVTGGYEALSALPALKSLALTWCKIADLTPLKNCRTLKTLSLAGNPVSDVSPLASLTALSSLDLSRTGVTELTAVTGLPLVEINLTGTAITDFSALRTSVYLRCGVATLSTAALAFNADAPLPTGETEGYNFGARKLVWSSAEPSIATVEGNAVRAGATQFALLTGTYACAVTGSVENSDATVGLVVTVGNGKIYKERWGSRATLARSVYGYPKTFTPKVENCTGFSLVTRQTAVKGDPFSVDWQIFIKVNGRTWTPVHTFQVTPGEYQYFDIVLDEAKTFNAVAVAPAAKLSSANTYNGGFELYGLKFAG